MKTGSNLVHHFKRRNTHCQIAILKIKPNQIARRQVFEAIGREDCLRFTFSQLTDPQIFNQFDGVVLALDGPSCKRVFVRLSKYEGPRPAILTLYPGLVFRYDYDGFAARAPADLVWLNCANDLAKYKGLRDSVAAENNGRNFGIATLLDPSDLKIKCNQSSLKNSINKTVVFFEQVAIPKNKVDRESLVKILFNIAVNNPDYTLIIKPRMMKTEKTVHNLKSSLHIENLIKDTKREKPDNVKISYSSANQLLKECDVCLTISSTVAIEAIHQNTHVAILNDFGFHDDDGVHYFLGSNLISSANDLQLNEMRKPDITWLKSHITNPNKTIEHLVDEFLELAEVGKTSGLPPIQISPWLGSKQHIAELRKLNIDDDSLALGWYRYPVRKWITKKLSQLYSLACAKRFRHH
ncbi:DUF6716 putative glycosyltransferase [Pseudovibrio brasiliensis]|uniref:Capsule polysaccharide biosynthesis protein n=1 Tax=Pseudovibrio brasiliensis TaxID=1898042 RepID=A0ABX8AKU7_9HYPH|nr:DUF6716 putative glycosyltransferase [Pseudovibrio brasiliensis]QUS54887.1 hypothetical protein KGB56_16125 [Pseudovibrio brasiliensis]